METKQHECNFPDCYKEKYENMKELHISALKMKERKDEKIENPIIGVPYYNYEVTKINL